MITPEQQRHLRTQMEDMARVQERYALGRDRQGTWLTRTLIPAALLIASVVALIVVPW